jgi:hypothetical protein
MTLKTLEARLQYLRRHGARDDTEVVMRVHDEDAVLRRIDFDGGGASELYIFLDHGARLEDL